MDKNQFKIQLIGHARSGSTYLMHLMEHACYHNDISVLSFAEPFNKDALIMRKRITQQRAAIINSRINKIENIDRVIVKNHINQFDYLEIDQLNRYNRIKFYNICNYRRDVTETVLSYVMARMTKVWVGELPDQIGSIHFDLDLVRREMIEVLKSYNRLFEADVTYDEVVVFEDLTFDQNADINHIRFFGEIGVTETLPHARTRPASKKSEVVSNYDEARDYILETLEQAYSENFELTDGIITATRID